MGKRLTGDFILICIVLFFSWWLMTKSFSYDATSSQFRIARHEVGDFGLHISLIRSFAWGRNTPLESPFFPGKPLMYHYAGDWLAGQFVRSGVRIDYALNGLSAVALTILLFGLYRLGGILSVILFLLPGNLSFIEFFKHAPKDPSFFSYLWRFPDYLHKGPFDGSMITIYTTLSPYLNQRHLIMGMAIGISVIWLVVHWAKKGRSFAILGFIMGLATRVHIVIAISTTIVVAMMLFGKRKKELFYFVVAFLIAAAGHLFSLRGGTAIQWWNPGYLSPRPVTLSSWVYFWIANLGILAVLIPLAFRHADGIGKRILLGAGLLFFIANSMQVSYRMEHNHSLINYAVVLALPFVARLIVAWWQRYKLVSLCVLFLATISGIVNLMVVKNDYQLMVDDAPRNRFMQWIQSQTDPSSMFIAQTALYDPVTLESRKNYLGHEYYVSVMGYDYWGRRKQIDTWLSNFNQSTIVDMKNQHITYMAIPNDRNNFPYTMNEEKIKSLLPVVYRDETIIVYEL